MVQVVGSSVRPGGRVPETIEQFVLVPPDGETGTEYDVPAEPLGGGGLNVNGFVVVILELSVTWMVKPKVPAVVGVPLRTPVVEFSVRPGGNDPETTDQV